MPSEWATHKRTQNHARLKVDARKTYTGEAIELLLRNAVLVLPAEDALILPEGVTLAGMATVRMSRPHSMAAGELESQAAGRIQSRKEAPTTGLMMDRRMGRPTE